MKNRTKGKILILIALFIIMITPYFMFPKSEELVVAGYRVFRNLIISLFISLIGIRYYFID